MDRSEQGLGRILEQLINGTRQFYQDSNPGYRRGRERVSHRPSKKLSMS